MKKIQVKKLTAVIVTAAFAAAMLSGCGQSAQTETAASSAKTDTASVASSEKTTTTASGKPAKASSEKTQTKASGTGTSSSKAGTSRTISYRPGSAYEKIVSLYNKKKAEAASESSAKTADNSSSASSKETKSSASTKNKTQESKSSTEKGTTSGETQTVKSIKNSDSSSGKSESTQKSSKTETTGTENQTTAQTRTSTTETATRAETQPATEAATRAETQPATEAATRAETQPATEAATKSEKTESQTTAHVHDWQPVYRTEYSTETISRTWIPAEYEEVYNDPNLEENFDEAWVWVVDSPAYDETVTTDVPVYETRYVAVCHCTGNGCSWSVSQEYTGDPNDVGRVMKDQFSAHKASGECPDKTGGGYTFDSSYHYDVQVGTTQETQVIHHDEEGHWELSPAWEFWIKGALISEGYWDTEESVVSTEVLDHYECSCGATKAN